MYIVTFFSILLVERVWMRQRDREGAKVVAKIFS
jgi:hypothetical protein